MERIYSNADGNDVNQYVISPGTGFAINLMDDGYFADSVRYINKDNPYIPKDLDVNSLNKVVIANEGTFVYTESASFPSISRYEVLLTQRNNIVTIKSFAESINLRDMATAMIDSMVLYMNIIISDAMRDEMINQMIHDERHTIHLIDASEWFTGNAKAYAYVSYPEGEMYITRKATSEDIAPVKEWYESKMDTLYAEDIVKLLNAIIYE